MKFPSHRCCFFFQLKSCLLNHDCILIRHLTCSTKNNPTSMVSEKKSTTKTTLIYTIKHFSAASKGNATSPDFSKGEKIVSRLKHERDPRHITCWNPSKCIDSIPHTQGQARYEPTNLPPRMKEKIHQKLSGVRVIGRKNVKATFLSSCHR